MDNMSFPVRIVAYVLILIVIANVASALLDMAMGDQWVFSPFTHVAVPILLGVIAASMTERSRR